MNQHDLTVAPGQAGAAPLRGPPGGRGPGHHDIGENS